MSSGDRLVILLDDVRRFRDGRPALVVRSSSEALALLQSIGPQLIDELWLDYDLVRGDTAQPVVDHLVALAADGSPLNVSRIEVHSSNAREGHRICDELCRAGYNARRNFAARLWIHDWSTGAQGHPSSSRVERSSPTHGPG